MIDFRPLGDRAFLARFDCESDSQHWCEAIRQAAIPGILDVAVAYASAAVFFDPDQVDSDELELKLRVIKPIDGNLRIGRLVSLPVLYDGEDLAEVARFVGLTEDEVIEKHSSCSYSVFALGFLPGFPYSGYLREPLAGLPRLTRPRLRIPGGSVAIAARQTGVYPTDSPGGWRILGRTPLRVVDLERGIFPIRAGDQLLFSPIGPDEFRARLGEPLALAQ